MPFSEDQLDQMLSGYLDDAIEPSERSQLEQLFRNDPELRDRLSAMQMIRQSLKELSQRDAHVKLDSSFADRVLNEAVSRARSGGLASDHPLVRVAEQPMRSRSKEHSAWNRKAIASILVIAASVGFATWTVLRSPAPEPLAKNTKMVTEETGEMEIMTASPSGLGIASNQPIAGNQDIAATRPTSSEENAMIGESANLLPPTRQMAASLPPAETFAEVPAASTGSTTIQPMPESVVSIGQSSRARPVAVIVLDVRQSERGRELHAVRQAFVSAEISPSSKKPVDGPIAQAATSAAGVSSDQRVSLMYLEASAKQLDDFYMALLRDRDGIQSVSMSLAMDAPLIDSIEELLPESETVATGKHATPLDGDANTLGDLVQQVDQLQFIPLGRDIAAGMSQSDGASVPAAVLVIIR